MPGAGHLFELFQQWAPDSAAQQRILVDNPTQPYDFPN
jgi:2-pyrone-4,6-dicarboxylate lactonase